MKKARRPHAWWPRATASRPNRSSRAQEAGVYVHNSPALVNLLMQVDMDSQIPPQLYLAVAQLLAWLHQIEDATVNRG
jgi:flagellar biosynthesis protein